MKFRRVARALPLALVLAAPHGSAWADHSAEVDYLNGTGEVARAGVYNTIDSTYIRGANYYRNPPGAPTRTTEQFIGVTQCNGLGQSCGTFAARRVTSTFGPNTEFTVNTGNLGSFGHVYKSCISITSPSWSLVNACTNLISHD